MHRGELPRVCAVISEGSGTELPGDLEPTADERAQSPVESPARAIEEAEEPIVRLLQCIALYFRRTFIIGNATSRSGR